MKEEPVVIEKTFNAPIAKVWKAITNKDDMKQWYFNLQEFKPEVGFEFQFEGGDEKKRYLHLCKVTEVIPGKKLTYSWRYDGYAGNSFVTWELFEEGTNKTKLRLTHAGLETFPKENPDLAKHNFVQGWTGITATLKDFVETTTIKKSAEINAPSSTVWKILLDTKQWANAFSEGAYVETDWKKGSKVVWKDKDGNAGATGEVVANEPNRMLKVSFYDDVTMVPPLQSEAYSETYTLAENKNKILLSIEAGPLAVLHANVHSPLWDKAVAMIKELAEK
jgi:uncharacterized protein YndB with AHSA1/START domain